MSEGLLGQARVVFVATDRLLKATQHRSARLARNSMRVRLEQEATWEDHLRTRSDHLFEQLNVDGAIRWAEAEWKAEPASVLKRVAELFHRASPNDPPQQAPPLVYTPPNTDLIAAQLAVGLNEAAWTEGAVQAYVALALDTGAAAAQVSLDRLGLNKTFAWAHPRAMGQDMYAVRGSKVIQGMYGAHLNRLSRIIADATDPRHPKTIAQVKATIKEQWPALSRGQVSTIARTETAAVWTATSVNAMRANGITSFESSLATGPSIGIDSEDPCDECVDAAANGPFTEDDDLPPWHPNCRCEAIPVLESESFDSGGYDSAISDWEAAGSVPETEPSLEDYTTTTHWLPPKEPWTGQSIPINPQELDSAGDPLVVRPDTPTDLIPADEPVPTPFPVDDEAAASLIGQVSAHTTLNSAEQFMRLALGNLQSGWEVRAITDSTGKLRGAVSFKNTGSVIYVRNLGSTIKSGGTELLRHAARAAVDAGLHVELLPADDALGFYEKLGFTDTGTGTVELRGTPLERLAARSGEKGAAVTVPPKEQPPEVESDPKQVTKSVVPDIARPTAASDGGSSPYADSLSDLRSRLRIR